MTLLRRVEEALAGVLGTPVRIKASRSAAGGCINDSRVLELEDGRRIFLKTNRDAARYPGLFETEYRALELLGAPGEIRVPKPLAWGEGFLVTEAFVEGPRARDWQERLGRRLALLHRATRQARFGFERDNYLGVTPQPNAWSDDWTAFWRERRLGWQLELCAAKTTADDPLLALGARLLERLDEVLAGADEAAVLLHGDLWSGNAAADENGEPVIFDPASYYGRREAEIGMMRLFGGFGPRCEAAYGEVWPLAEGADRRIALYRLYHELNHLNLFGRSYYDACLSTIRSLL